MGAIFTLVSPVYRSEERKREIGTDTLKWNQYLSNLKRTKRMSHRSFKNKIRNMFVKRWREKYNKTQKWKRANTYIVEHTHEHELKHIKRYTSQGKPIGLREKGE